MSLISSTYAGAEVKHSSFIVIFKIYADAIHLWSNERMKTLASTHTLRILCLNVGSQKESPSSSVQVFVMTYPVVNVTEKSAFQQQNLTGQPISSSDLAIFMTTPETNPRQVSYAIQLAIGKNNFNDETDNTSDNNYEKLGAAYLYMDPKFSTQGTQKIPIIAAHTNTPIGQIQIEYLIVTNPVAYDLPPPKPDWLFKCTGLEAGHRGSGSGRRLDLPEKLLENTIASFNYAHRHGADMCELDVLVSADGVPVVYHDFDVDAVTAQQSTDTLGKFRVQVNEFTVKQLRDFCLLSLNDGQGCPYTLKVSSQAEDNKPFPTLAEVLNQVDESCGLNIEIKWPQQLESGKMEARKYREINDFVERIIDVVSLNARKRRVILESFDADLVILLRLKQNTFPVIFLSQGLTDKYERYMDMRARSLENGIRFAQAFRMAGVDIILEYYLNLGKELVDLIHNHGLIARAWGDIGDGPTTISTLRQLGLQCITYDKIDLIRRIS